MKYLITFKDPDKAVQGPDGGFVDLPAEAEAWFEYGEYVTLEWDSDTRKMCAIYPTRKLRQAPPTPASELRVAWMTVRSGSKFYDIGIYTDRAHTCTCPSWFFGNTKHALGWCKHIREAVADLQDAPRHTITWVDTTHADRIKFKEDQTRFYDGR